MNQFLYIQFNVDPKATIARPTGSEMVVIELPTKHVNDWKLERPDRKLSDDEIAILITEPVAIATADRFVAYPPAAPAAGDPLREIRAGALFGDE